MLVRSPISQLPPCAKRLKSRAYPSPKTIPQWTPPRDQLCPRCVVYFGPPLTPGLQELRLQQFLDRVPHADRWEVNQIPNSEGFRTACFHPKCHSEVLEVYHKVQNMADTQNLPFSRYSIPGFTDDAGGKKEGNKDALPSVTEPEPSPPPPGATSSTPPLPKKLYYSHRNHGTHLKALLQSKHSTQYHALDVGRVDFHFPPNTPVSDQMPSIWSAHSEWLDTTNVSFCWDRYHDLMTLYQTFSTGLEVSTKNKIRGKCIQKFLQFAVKEYLVEDNFVGPFPVDLTPHTVYNLMESVYGHHKSWLYEVGSLCKVNKETYLHFMQVYKKDMYLPVELRDHFTREMKWRRLKHFEIKQFSGRESGDPFS